MTHVWVSNAMQVPRKQASHVVQDWKGSDEEHGWRACE